MIKNLVSIVDHRHDVGVVMFIVIVEGIEDDREPVPPVRGAEDFAGVITTLHRVPEGLGTTPYL